MTRRNNIWLDFVSKIVVDSDLIGQAIDYVKTKEVNCSTKKNYLIDLTTVLRRKGYDTTAHLGLQSFTRALNSALLRTPIKKAPLLSQENLHKLLTTQDMDFAVALALMIPSGARFGDVSHIRKEDLEMTDKTVVWTVKEAKNIRNRGHQRRIALTVPTLLVEPLRRRLLQCAQGEKIVTLDYAEVLARVKTTVGRAYTTYSIRRTAMEGMRMHASTLEEIQDVTLHRSKDQLAQYLTGPTNTQKTSHLALTSWHSSP